MIYSKHVALCGFPSSGKTTVAQLLERIYGGIIIDDGAPLREGAKATLGLTDWHVSTHEGKASLITYCGRTITVRQYLGEYGNFLEAYFGDQIMPELAIATASYFPNRLAIYPSCRKNQGRTYRNYSGAVIEVIRPGCEPKFDFDKYDQSFVSHSIYNDGTLADLEYNVRTVLDSILGGY